MLSRHVRILGSVRAPPRPLWLTPLLDPFGDHVRSSDSSRLPIRFYSIIGRTTDDVADCNSKSSKNNSITHEDVPGSWLSEDAEPVTQQKKTSKRQTKELHTSSDLTAPGTKHASAALGHLSTVSQESHIDLASFIDYAARNDLSSSTTVYKGTHYEYTVMDSLAQFGFHLRRTGRANDLGVDLVGHWTVPVELSPKSRKTHETQDLKVLFQCKATKALPAMVRELEGAYVGAPSGWRGGDVIAFLATSEPTTKGVREAVQRSRWPISVLHVSREGSIYQLLWNAVAARQGLEGMGVTSTYGISASKVEKTSKSSKNTLSTASELSLTWMGQLWRGKK